MRWPFTGRDAELRFVGEAVAGGSIGGVVIAGPAGVGKTRLTAEAAELAGAEGCAVEWVRASGSARSIPLGAFAALLPATGGPLPAGVEL
ncbi:MAG TPA: AAA family ATPase, partial [Solirubrobacteraceae bacterium]